MPRRMKRTARPVQERVEEILQKAQQSGQADQREILFIRAGSKASATKAKTAEDHFACAMLQEMGIHNIAEDAPGAAGRASLEEILLRDPDYIFVSTMGDEQAAKDYLEGVFARRGMAGAHRDPGEALYLSAQRAFSFQAERPLGRGVSLSVRSAVSICVSKGGHDHAARQNVPLPAYLVPAGAAGGSGRPS